MADDLWMQDYRVLNEMVSAFTVNPTPPDDPDADPDLAGDAVLLEKAHAALDEALGQIPVRQSLDRLFDASPPYLISGEPTQSRPGSRAPTGVTERGLRATGAWPTDRDAGQGGRVW